MRNSRLHRIAIVVVAVALGSAVIATDAVAAGGNAGGHGGWGMGGHFSGAMGGSHFGGGMGRGFGGGHFGGAMGGGRIGGGSRGGHFGDGRFAGRFAHGHGVRGLPFGYYDDWDSGYGYYDPSTVAPDAQLTYPAPVVPSRPAPDAKVVSNPYSGVPSEEPDLLRPGELLVRFPPPKKISR
jgi:hypothetical protein